MAFNPLSAALNWLRAGYPDGIPREDYVALFAVLRHRLTETEIREAAATITAERDAGEPIDADEIETAIADLLLQEPNDEDVERVKARLSASGWDVAGGPEESSADPAVQSSADPAVQSSADPAVQSSADPAVQSSADPAGE